jgi:hypothetical protein
MSDLNKIRRGFKIKLSEKQNSSDAIAALLGLGNGTVSVPSQPGQVYIRVGNQENYGTAYNDRVPNTDNLPVYVGYDPITDPGRRLFQVLSIRQSSYVGSGSTPIPSVGPHHTTHEFGGGDDVYTDWRRLMGLRVGRPGLPGTPTAFVVTVDPGCLYRAGAWMAAPVGLNTADLTVQHGLLFGTQAQWVLISLDPTGAISVLPVVPPKASLALLLISDIPTPPAGNIPLAAVRIYASQTAIGDAPSAPDIYDLRFPTYAGMNGPIGSGVAGRVAEWLNANTLQAANIIGPAANILSLTATAASTLALAITAGKVLTFTTLDDYNLTAEITGAVIVRSATPNVVAGAFGAIPGNARGVGAIDLQLDRSVATQVASGQYAAIPGGANNTASGNYSLAFGLTCVASDSKTIAFGNSAQATAQYAIAVGSIVLASGQDAVAIGSNITASGLCATTIGGIDNVAAGDYSVALGRRAKIAAAHDGTFLFADLTDADFNSLAAGEFAFRARGGFRHAYDDSNYWTASISAAGVCTFATLPVGAGFVFTPTVTFTAAPVLSSTTASTVIYSDASRNVVSLANAAGYLYNNGAGALSYVATAAPTAHNVLSASHGDTTSASCVLGDIITGQAGPVWARLAITVPAATFMDYIGTANGDTTPGYKALFDATVPGTIAESAAAAAGTAVVAARRDHTHGAPATWAPTAHNQAWATITGTPTTLGGYGITDVLKAGAGVLTLSAAGAYSVAFPKSGTTVMGTGDAGGGVVAIWTGTNDLSYDGDLTFSGTRLTATDLTVTNAPIISSLTATRVVFAGGSKELVDDSDLTFSGSRLTATDLTVTNAPIISSLTNTWIIYAGASKELVGSANATLDSSGNVALKGILNIGDTTAPAGLTLLSAGFSTNTAAGISLLLRKSNTGTNPPNASFLKSRNTAASPAAVENADILGSFDFYGFDGTNYIRGATINITVDGAPGTNDMPGRMGFWTTLDGTASPTENMRIDNAHMVYAGYGLHVGALSGTPGDNNLLVDGTSTITGAFGCNAAVAQTAYASGGALAAYATGAFGLNSDANMSALHAMVVKIRAALVANGIMS